MTRLYEVTFFEYDDEGLRIYAAKKRIITETLDRSCKRLIKKFGRQASVEKLLDGRYIIAGGLAEMRCLSTRRGERW